MPQSVQHNTTVRVLAPTDPMLKAVVALSDANVERLGMFPASCFEREAAAGKLLVAVDSALQFQGFLLYRVACRRAVVQQLCVAPEFRGQGVGHVLTDDLKERTRHLDGIALHCAREFEDSAAAWRSMGFVAVDEKRGRGKDARPLTRFWFDHRNVDLFSAGRDKAAEERLVVVMDANVVFDLQDGSRPTAGLSRPLRDEWLEEYIGLWVTDELFNEVDRHSDRAERTRRKGFIRALPKLNDDRKKTSAVVATLSSLLCHGERASDRSDLHQLASAISGNAAVFVTHDEPLLNHAELVDQHFGLQVLRPSDLIARLDEVARAHEFAPVRLAGTAVEIRRAAEDDLERLSALFLNHGTGEKKHEFEKAARRIVSSAAHGELSLVEGPQSEFTALTGMKWNDPLAVTVSLLRVKATQLAPTLARKLVVRCIRRTLTERRRVIYIDDSHAGPAVASACAELGFVHANGVWAKLCLPGTWSRQTALQQVPAMLCQAETMIRSELVAEDSSKRARQDARAEQLIWPGKLVESSLPTFIVPIQPRFAQCLFDEALASNQLLGIDPLLIFNCEHVYYRSSHAEVVEAPSRILWYTSQDRQSKVQQLRACSQVLEVAVDSAKALFRRFRRLGVYEWKEVDAIAKKNPKGELMAIRFGMTELLPAGLRRDGIERVLTENGQAMPPLSMPVRISDRSFLQLYRDSHPGGSI